MNEFIKPILLDKIIRLTLLISLGLLFLSLLIVGIFYTSLPPFIPLFNQMPWGEARLAPTWMFFLLPAVTIFIAILNIAITKFIYEKMPLVARMLHTTTLLLSIFTIIFIFRSIRLII